MATRHRSSIEPKWVLVFVFFVAGAFMGGLCTYLYTNAVRSAATNGATYTTQPALPDQAN